MNILAMVELPYGFGYLFDPMFNAIAGIRDDVFGSLTYFIYVLAFAGLLICVYKQQMGGDLGQVGNQLLMTAVVAVSLHFMKDWILDAENVLGFSMLESMNIDMESIMVEWLAMVASYLVEQIGLIVAALTAAAAVGFFAIVAGIVAIVYAIIAAIMLIVVALWALFVWLALLAAYIIQAVSIELGIATAPLFLGMFLFPTTKETATRYFTGIVAMMMWPLGWGLGFKLMELINGVVFIIINTNGALIALNVIFAGVVDGMVYIIEAGMFWTIIKKAPPLVTKALTTGTQIGAGLVSAGVASAATTVSTAVSAAGSVASSTMSAAGTVAGAAIGGAVSGGAGAGVGASVGGAVGGAAGSAVSGAAGAAASGIKGAGEGLAGMSEGV